MTRVAFVSTTAAAGPGAHGALGLALADTTRWTVHARSWAIPASPAERAARLARALTAGLRGHDAVYAASSSAADEAAAVLDALLGARQRSFAVNAVDALLAVTTIPGASAPDHTAEAWDDALDAVGHHGRPGAADPACDAAHLAEAYLRVTSLARDVTALPQRRAQGHVMVELLDRRSGDTRLYGGDYYAWTQDQAARLRRQADRMRALDPALDPEQIARELRDHGRDELREVRQALVRTISQLLERARDCANRSWEHEAKLHQREAMWFFTEGMRADLDMAPIHAKALKMANAVFKSRGLAPLPADEPLPLALDDLLARDVPVERHVERLRTWIATVGAPTSVH